HDPTVVAPDPVEHRGHQRPREPAPGEAFGDDRVLEFEGARSDLTIGEGPDELCRGLVGEQLESYTIDVSDDLDRGRAEFGLRHLRLLVTGIGDGRHRGHCLTEPASATESSCPRDPADSHCERYMVLAGTRRQHGPCASGSGV